MEDKNNFSVLMSLYYKENPEHLNICLLSLHQQTLKANEIVIVLDGDIGQDLHTVLDSWKNALPLKIYPLDTNIGLGRALNFGLQRCSYDIVARMDTDDICRPNRFEVQIPFFKNDYELILVGSAIREFEGSVANIKGVRFSRCSCTSIKDYAKIRNPFNHMSVVYRKSAILSLGGYIHHLYMEDYNLWLRLLASGAKCINIPDVLIDVRVGDAMLSRRSGLQYIKSEWQLLRLKIKLKTDSAINGSFIFILRAAPRLFPQNILALVYKSLRGK